MEYLRKLPDNPFVIKDLVKYQKGMVVSRCITTGEHYSVIVLALDSGESISDEAYPRDTLYFCLDGNMLVCIDGEKVSVEEGNSYAVKANKLHAIEGKGRFKVLQLQFN